MNRPTGVAMNHCTWAKACGPEAAAASHQTSNTVPAEAASPVTLYMMDRIDVSCGR